MVAVCGVLSMETALTEALASSPVAVAVIIVVKMMLAHMRETNKETHGLLREIRDTLRGSHGNQRQDGHGPI